MPSKSSPTNKSHSAKSGTRRRRYTTMRVPTELLRELRLAAKRLEDYLDSGCTVQQAKLLYLPGDRHERFGIAPWQVVERLLHQDKLRRKRQANYRAQPHQRRKTKPSVASQAAGVHTE